MAIDTQTDGLILPPTGSQEHSLLPSEAVSRLLDEGAEFLTQGDIGPAAARLTAAANEAAATVDYAGYGRAMAQLAALEESTGDIAKAFAHNQLAQETFLAIGDGAGLVQTFRVDGFLHLRANEYTPAAHCFGKALGLALQLDGRLVLTTLNQVVPAANYLIESDNIQGLLPLGVALAQAVESADGEHLPDLRDFAELAETIAGVFTPLGVMADEPGLTAAKRRQLAARSTHQAWLVDALTKRRWGLAALVKETLQTKMSFHEELD